jgi:hypothetical protein
MSERIKFDQVSGPQGDFEVSTIRTDAGGAMASSCFGAPFSTADYVNETPWPFETMVFHPNSSRGLYHEPHRTKQQAEEGHRYAVSLIKSGTLTLGAGVRGDFGVPAMTPQEWADRMSVKAARKR